MALCNYPAMAPHELTKTYYQTDEYGDICQGCHDGYLMARGMPAHARKSAKVETEEVDWKQVAEKSMERVSELWQALLALNEHVLASAPLHWAVAHDVDGAHGWEKKAHELCVENIKLLEK